MKLAIAYHSASGHTKKLAQCVYDGVSMESDSVVHLLDVTQMDPGTWKVLDAADGIIFGAPTFMGGVTAPFKAFIDKTGDFWLDLRWTNKMAAGFTIGSGSSGDKLGTLIQLSIFAAQHGMLWVGQQELGSQYSGDGQGINECGSWLGLMATSSRDRKELITSTDALTARMFGQRVAKATRRWQAGR